MGELQRAIEALKADLGDIDAMITLGVSAERAEDGSWTWCLATDPSPHSIVVRHGKTLAREWEAAHALAPQRSSEEQRAEAWARLDKVFGPPGFDSGARAAVFRELAEGLRDEGFVTVLECLRCGKESADAQLDRARHGLARVLERGPSGMGEGCRILRELHADHGLAGILERVASRWHFGD